VLTATAVGVPLTPGMGKAWQLVALWGVAVGLSTGFVGAYLAASIAARWFRVREGLVVGILTAANAAGQLVFLPRMAALATSAGRPPATWTNDTDNGSAFKLVINQPAAALYILLPMFATRVAVQMTAKTR
jgi:hypothetical protein